MSDDDLFRAVAEGTTIAVGHSSTAAQFVVADNREVRRFLQSLIRTGGSATNRSDTEIRPASVG